MRILLVEDDEALAMMVRDALSAQHYVVDLADSGQMGWDLAEAFDYDLILLDLCLPELNGIAFCRQRRDRGDLTPILLMTARDDREDKVQGLDAGADDYLVKPFDLEELLARIRALLRRGSDSLPPAIAVGPLRLDPSSCQVTYEGTLLKLTAKEYALIELFLRNPHRIFSQSALLDHLWSFEEPPSETAVRTQIKGLRQKLRQGGAKSDAIETVYGLGYRLNSKLSETSPQAEQLAAKRIPLGSHLPLAPSRLNEIWERHRTSYLHRIDVLEQAAIALRQAYFSEELRQQAIQEAHTLAGSLGSFGFTAASETAREIEKLLRGGTALNSQSIERLEEAIARLLKELAPKAQESEPSQPPPPSRQQNSSAKSKLLIVDDDIALAQAIATAAKTAKIQGEIAASLSQAREAIAHNRPDVVLLDLSFPNSSESGFILLSELSAVEPPIPTVVFTAQESFADRVKVARLGGRSFLHKPIAPSQVIDEILRVLQQSHPPLAKVLIVDDDPHILDLLRTLLEPWGLRLLLLDDPQQFWQTLETANPDLLILDIKMPNFSGIDLCQVVRNDPKWQDLPILMLSAHRNSQIVQQVFMAGADDYIQKPIVEPELIARILNRLERKGLHRRRAIASNH